ncbi:PTS ascorbate transporter subunit IIC [Cytobacillus oceanisediminis]|uniref:PTS ascorbate transporter subunit IIC n=1 Tax=Bacillaceae TaxID=186817 RepID=UPI000C78518C|nr:MULTISPECIES: PTS ascorbate transporter subunit IIC [Bacillaceae]MBQ6448875.1 PTS ascorbate transporter subunit IIC [Bacillus sp. (in: firmicutes)]MBZ9534498.1 PTS ascorbate transporter subunit IIC [Cytobacillus oceanisediminis]UTI41992.1 PTS ascorbate transporter subunit IIC [Niallia sp. RD1]
MNLSGVWNWTFFWNSFGYFLKTVASFLMVIVAIIAVGMLLNVVINAIRNGKQT